MPGEKNIIWDTIKDSKAFGTVKDIAVGGLNGIVRGLKGLAIRITGGKQAYQEYLKFNLEQEKSAIAKAEIQELRKTNPYDVGKEAIFQEAYFNKKTQQQEYTYGKGIIKEVRNTENGLMFQIETNNGKSIILSENDVNTPAIKDSYIKQLEKNQNEQQPKRQPQPQNQQPPKKQSQQPANNKTQNKQEKPIEKTEKPEKESDKDIKEPVQDNNKQQPKIDKESLKDKEPERESSKDEKSEKEASKNKIEKPQPQKDEKQNEPPKTAEAPKKEQNEFTGKIASNNKNLNKGDHVLVPTGKTNEFASAVIVSKYKGKVDIKFDNPEFEDRNQLKTSEVLGVQEINLRKASKIFGKSDISEEFENAYYSHPESNQRKPIIENNNEEKDIESQNEEELTDIDLFDSADNNVKSLSEQIEAAKQTVTENNRSAEQPQKNEPEIGEI